MSHWPDRIFFNGGGLDHHQAVSTVKFAGGAAYIHEDQARERILKLRETFRIAVPGSDEEYAAWLAGCDAALEALGERQ